MREIWFCKGMKIWSSTWGHAPAWTLCTCVDHTHIHARGADFLVFCHGPAWATKVSPNLINLKVHPRGFHGGYKLDLEKHKRGFEIGKVVGFSKRERVGNVIGVQGLRGLDLWLIISFFFFYFHDCEL